MNELYKYESNENGVMIYIIRTLSRSLARPPRRSTCRASCGEMLTSAPESCNFCFTNDKELVASASDKAMEFSGFDGKAIGLSRQGSGNQKKNQTDPLLVALNFRGYR